MDKIFRSVIKLKDDDKKYIAEFSKASYNFFRDETKIKCFSSKEKELVKKVKKTDVESVESIGSMENFIND